jgi:colanic acid/amylovoran biosynthesis glycosyltransferase
MRIALFNPEGRSEASSFVVTHLHGLQGEVVLFHGGDFPTFVENEPLDSLTWKDKLFFRLFGKRSGLQRNEFALLQTLRSRKIDFVFIEYGTGAAATISVLKKFKRPFLVHFHGYDAHMTKVVQKYKAQYRLVFEEAKAIVVVSQWMKSQLQLLGAPLDKLHYTCCGVQQPFLKEKAVEYPKKEFVFVGRFVEKKGPLELLQSFYLAHQKHVDYKLILVGDGPLLEECKAWVREHKLESVVEFKGKCSHTQVLTYMKSATAYVQHSKVAVSGDSEGTPVSVLEAMSLGLAVVATRHAGIQDVIEDGNSGLLSNEGDTQEMANNMILVIEDETRRKRLGDQARKRILEHYTAGHHLNILNALLQ